MSADLQTFRERAARTVANADRGCATDQVDRYSAGLGFEIVAHALRATAATNALDHEADIAKVQECARRERGGSTTQGFALRNGR